MPPNLNKNGLFVSGSAEVESLNIPIQSKFLPLTDPKEAQQHQHEEKSHRVAEQEEREHEQQYRQSQENNDAAKYWDWPSETIEEEDEEAIADLFSLSRIESNLIADSIRAKSEPSVSPSPSKNENNSNNEESESYWTWSKDTDRDNKDLPLFESENEEESSDHHHEECCEDYWTWDSEVILPRDVDDDNFTKPPSREETNHNIVVNHSHRRKKYGRRHSLLPEPTDPTDHKYASDHYWHWSETKFESFRNRRKEFERQMTAFF